MKVRNDLVCTEQAQFHTNCEIVWVKLEVAGAHPLFICAYYKPKEEDQESLEELRRSVDELKKHSKGNIWILGDFNLPNLTWTDNIPSMKPDCASSKTYDLFLDLLNDFGFTQMVTLPTRHENVLDLFLTSNPTLVDQVDCRPGLGDHDMVTASCAIKPSIQKQKPRKVPLLGKADWPKFKSLMRDYQQKFLLNHFNRSVEELWSDFVTTIDTYASKCVPTKTIRGKTSLPWITQDIRRQIRRKDDLYRKFKKTGDQVFRNKFLSQRKLLKRNIKASHNSYLEGLLGLTDENSVCNNKKLFSFLKSSKQDQTGSPPLQKGSRLVTDTTEKADIHNQQFQSVFTTKAPLSLSRLCKMKIQDMTDSGKTRHDAVPAELLNSNPKMEEFSISCNGILKLLQNLKPFKAAGPDRLKPLLLKELREEIAPIIQIIFERSLQTGKLPADWCRAQVTPIFKKGSKSSAANYRPISLTCILCKALEHIIASQVVKHLNSHDLLYDLQHGFREKRSCETQLTMLVEDLARNLSKGKQTDLVLLDFSKAFDKVNHSKLLWKLHQYGIRGHALAWIRAFLGNRSQTVVLEGEESGSVPVTSGVPQGSVLGPILFLVYINDLPDELSSQVRLFADDTAVYLTIGGAEDGKVLQTDLDRLSVWEDRWDMEFNPSKCQVVRVTSSRTLFDIAYTLHGQVLEVVTSAKYLGVDISNGLSWNPHIDRITGNANRTLNFIQRNIKTKNQKVRETAYNTLVRPQLEYAAPVWDPYFKEKILQLEKVQRRAARWTTSSFDYRSSVTAIVNDLGWRTLEQRRADARLCLFFKIVHGLVALPLPDYIHPSNRISRYCHSMTFRQLHTSTSYYKYSFFPLAIVQWNALPETVACLPDLDSFKVAVSKLQHIRP